jgi:hypothetical protein
MAVALLIIAEIMSIAISETGNLWTPSSCLKLSNSYSRQFSTQTIPAPNLSSNSLLVALMGYKRITRTFGRFLQAFRYGKLVTDTNLNRIVLKILPEAQEELKNRILVRGITKTLTEPLQKNERVIVVGDIHGELGALLAILLSAGLIDPQTGDWIGGSNRLKAIGDVINRGYRHSEVGKWPLESNMYLRHLSVQARNVGGDVQVIAGNTEMRMFQRHKDNLEGYLRQNAVYEALRMELLAQASIGHLFAVLSVGGLLLAHAIVSNEFVQKDESLSHFVHRVNKTFIEAVEKDDFSHPLFQQFRGIMWLNVDQATSPAFDQIHGHNERLDGQVSFEFGNRAINIDVGLTKGNLGYVVLEENTLQAFSLESHKEDRRSPGRSIDTSA